MKKYRNNIGFDLDGVIIDFGNNFNNFAKKYFGLDLEVKYSCYYDIDKRLDVSRNLVDEILKEYYDPKKYFEGEFFDDVKETLNSLNKEGFEIYFITAADERILHIRQDNLVKHFPFLKKDNIFQSKEKFEIVNEKKIGYFVDDHNGKIKNIEENCPHCKPIFLFKGYMAIPQYQPKNTINNLKEIFDFINIFHE